MGNRLLERLRGQVRVEIVCAYPERVLNLCAARGLPFRDLRRRDNSLYMTVRSWRT